jgi:hypothetical protein
LADVPAGPEGLQASGIKMISQVLFFTNLMEKRIGFPLPSAASIKLRSFGDRFSKRKALFQSLRNSLGLEVGCEFSFCLVHRNKNSGGFSFPVLIFPNNAGL